MSGSCPICSAPTTLRYRPFCSKRCADVDLHRWLSGNYAVPALDPMDGIDDAADGVEPVGRAGPSGRVSR